MAISKLSTARTARLLIAFCDIDGFAHIAKRLGDDKGMFDFMDGYAKLAESSLDSQGLVIKWMGDEFIFVTEVPDAGIRALLEAKAKLEAYLAERCGGTLRIQAHVGDAVIGPFGSKGLVDIYGETVNRAATFCRERRSGSVTLSPEAFRSLTPETRKLFRRQTPQIVYLQK